MRTCSICVHPQRHEIDRALIGRDSSLRDIEGQFGVSRSALSRHKREHLLRILRESEETERLQLKGELLDQVELLKEEAWSIKEQARTAGNLPTALTAIREARASIELLLELRLEEEIQQIREEIAEMRIDRGTA